MKTLKLIALSFLLLPIHTEAQRRNKKEKEPTELVSDKEFHHLKWRNIGPFRGGRSVTSTGVVGQPNVYYMGGTGGGIWKTIDGGVTWLNVSDGFLKTGSVGAIAVSESDPNVVVAGMGEHAARGVMTSMGDGVYKSTDAGKTWTHIGLDNSRHISDVIIHPTNPDIIYITAQGAQYGPSKERGVYRTTDGGNNWERILYVNETTGASSLSMDMTNPRILYAAMWQHRRYPWTMESGGKDSGLYKSTDGGTTWNQMKAGLPEDFGKSGISVSRANPDKVFAVIEAEGKKAGVYRSDNAGKSWKQVNSDRVTITRSWYYMEIFADPQNENVVYVLNAPVLKSIDGGKSFSGVSVPHGDNHHLWINPNDNTNMINSNDGGANISFNDGKSWSTQQNQPTAQFYRVIADNLVPYNVYGGQQDNSAISIKSRTNDGGIDWKDWHSVAGCESAFLAFDPDNPEHVYGGCYQGIIERFVTSANTTKPIKEYPELGLSIQPKDFKYRYNWNAPIISSSHDRSTIYHAGNVVFKTQDGGSSWEVVSPDLTKNEKDKQGPGGGPYTNEAAGGENYNTLMSLVESPHEQGILYAGSDDGLLHITKDGGQNWTNITPKNISDGIINSIEVSPHDPATAYIVIMRYKSMDLKPYVFKTNNYGQSWTKIVNGFNDPHGFVRVIREDKKRRGLLYAGTETGLYISFTDGAHWQQFQLNLPVVAINDLVIQDNDLVAATAGRSFWILDDLGALQNISIEKKHLRIYKPKDTYRIFGGSISRFVPGVGQNPKSGVTFDYFIGKDIDTLELKLEVLEAGKVIRTISSKKDKEFKSWEGGPSTPQVLPAKKGYNRFTWNFQREQLPGVENVFVHGGYSGSSVAPGNYTLRLALENGGQSETEVTILPNPNVASSPSDFREQQTVLLQIENTIRDIHESVNNMRSAKSQLKKYAKLLKDNDAAKDLLEKGKTLMERITTWEENLIQPKQKTFQDVINFNNKLNSQLMHLKGFIDVDEPKVTQGSKERLQDLLNEWNTFKSERDAIINSEMAAYNKQFKELNLPAIIMKN
ncbi:glycosyl hydrolase [Flavobacteriaceae bacterium S0825]|uniref:WD40/YVTN/BNR-like repeat-containing protein n=1 Tax=Gaetbulibacter sp. S0825 TaxID=2720084 RepID=UPI001430D049|nr:exo-alpha-sialidase [Gaetbulibacter sp. S0825]MCK0108960.1 glycosyl hydrolase [Flavobacteriaceae bacterium S0825]NIX64595.1 glycosyl hydrolase [Gaetbulibacter sp. S0825]